MREASLMKWHVRNIKFLVTFARGLTQWRSLARMETENGQIHQLHSMYIPLDAALLHGRPYRSRRHL